MLITSRSALLAEPSPRLMYAASQANARAIARAGQAQADRQFAELMERTGLPAPEASTPARPLRFRLEVTDPQIKTELRQLAAARAW